MQAAIFIITVSFIVNIECKMEPFIVGGQDAQIIQFPHIAFLGILCVSENEIINSFICGSSIINQNIVLTAAHCLFGSDCTLKVVITVGHQEKEKGDMRTSSKFVLHEEYNDDVIENDIALVFVAQPFNLNSRVQRVVLMENPPYDDEAMVAGWGIINEETSAEPEGLQYTKQYVWDKSKCLNQFKFMPKDTLCARNKNRSSFVARGDSGGPLVVRGYIQIGIVSNKIPGISRSTVVYTDVGPFYKWIYENAHGIMCS